MESDVIKWITDFGGWIVGGFGLMGARLSWPWIIDKVMSRFPKKNETEIVSHRLEMKKQFIDAFGLNAQFKLENSPEIIIRDLKRLKEYPNEKQRKGISAYFKVELRGLYYNGIEVYLGLPSEFIYEECSKSWRKPNKKETGEPVYLIGRIPFDFIERLDMDGDEYGGEPHVFCKFSNNSGPYECIVGYKINKRKDGTSWEENIGVYSKGRIKEVFV
jgi:hypothetical protein